MKFIKKIHNLKMGLYFILTYGNFYFSILKIKIDHETIYY